MDVLSISEKLGFSVISHGIHNAEVSRVFCCDILSLCLSQLRKNDLWVTVSGGLNSVAAAYAAGASCIVLACGVTPSDDSVILAAEERGIWILGSEKNIFDAAVSVYELINLKQA